MGSIRAHVRGNIVGYVALFFTLSLGTAWALEANSVKSKHIVNGQVKAKDTKQSQVQARVDETCSAGRSIRAIGEDGSVTCETVGGGGAPTGPAGGDLAGSSYPNPLIAAGAVNSAKVANDSLTGVDINESSLGTVPSAAQGGTGRYGFTGSCNPESGIFVDCSSVSVPLSAPGRVLIIGQVMAAPDDGGEWGKGGCRLKVDGALIEASETKFWWDEGDPGNGYENATLTAVSNVLPAGSRFVGIECNETYTGDGSGSLYVELARISAARLTGGLPDRAGADDHRRRRATSSTSSPAAPRSRSCARRSSRCRPRTSGSCRAGC